MDSDALYICIKIYVQCKGFQNLFLQNSGCCITNNNDFHITKLHISNVITSKIMYSYHFCTIIKVILYIMW